MCWAYPLHEFCIFDFFAWNIPCHPKNPCSHNRHGSILLKLKLGLLVYSPHHLGDRQRTSANVNTFI